jgi:hypothetical protein
MDPAQLKAAYDQTQYLSNEINKVDENLFKTQGLQSAEILANAERTNWANENRNNRNTQFLIDNINDKSARIVSDINKTSTDSLLTTERVGVRLDDNIYKTTMAIEDVVHRATSDVRTDLTKVGMEAQKNTNELIGFIKQSSDQSWKNFNDSTRDILGTKNDLLLSSANQFSSLAKQASDNLTSVQIESLKSKADLSKQMSYEYNNLKDILARQEADRLRDELRSAEHKSLYFELKNGRRHRRHHH